MVTIIESFLDTLQLERAFIAEIGGDLWPIAVLSGIQCSIDTKPGPLRDGLAWCAPMVVDLDNWPIFVRLRRESPGEPPREEMMFNVTADPRIVKAARRWAELVASGKAVAGLNLLED